MGPKGKSTGKGKNIPSQAEKNKKGPSNSAQPAPASSGKKKGGNDNKAAAPDKQSKAAKKLERDAREQQRLADRDEMLNGMPSYDSDDDKHRSDSQLEIPGVSKKKAKDLTTDKFGNTVSKSKLAEDKRVEEMRAAARARREAKEQEKLNAEQDQSLEKSCGPSHKRIDITVDDLQRKLDGGVKLTHKEKKALKSQNRSENDARELLNEDPQLASFSLSLQPQRGVERGDSEDSGGEVAEWQTASATDVLVPCFSMTAPSRNLLVDASLRIVSGKRYGVVGSNGCGKSTLLRFLAARRFPVPNGVDILMVQQEVSASPVPVYQQVLLADTQRELYAQQLQKLEEQIQQQESQEGRGWTEDEWRNCVERYVQVGEQWEASGADSREAKVRRILTGLGFTVGMQEGGSEELSGGWRMRVSLATALFMEPKLLLLDEPTNHLDLDAVLWLDDYLCNHWSKQSTVLVVSHDADFLDSVCSDILHLDDAQITSYKGDYSYFESLLGKILAKKEKQYQIQMKTMREFTKGNGQLSQEKAEKKTMQKLNISSLREKPREYKVNFVLHAAEDDSPAIDMLDVSFRYSGQFLFERVRLKVDCHSRVAIVGPNGAGKSTLLRLLRGTLEPTRGEVIRHHHLRIGWYDQHFESLLPFDLSPVAFLVDSCGVDKLEARKYLGMFGLDGSRHLIKIGQLSGGQKSRVILASISLQRPNILILDEPTNHLDMESVGALIRAIKLFAGGVVLVSHDARLIADTECDIWVVGDSEEGIREERQGFTKYRHDVMASIARREAAAELRAKQAAAKQKARRAEQVAAARRFTGRGNPGSTSATDSAAVGKVAVSSIFRKDSGN